MIAAGTGASGRERLKSVAGSSLRSAQLPLERPRSFAVGTEFNPQMNKAYGTQRLQI